MKDYSSLRERLGISLIPPYQYDETVSLLLLTPSIFTKIWSMSLAEAVRTVVEDWPEEDRVQARIAFSNPRPVIGFKDIHAIYEKPDFPKLSE